MISSDNLPTYIVFASFMEEDLLKATLLLRASSLFQINYYEYSLIIVYSSSIINKIYSSVLNVHTFSTLNNPKSTYQEYQVICMRVSVLILTLSIIHCRSLRMHQLRWDERLSDIIIILELMNQNDMGKEKGSVMYIWIQCFTFILLYLYFYHAYHTIYHIIIVLCSFLIFFLDLAINYTPF